MAHQCPEIVMPPKNPCYMFAVLGRIFGAIVVLTACIPSTLLPAAPSSSDCLQPPFQIAFPMTSDTSSLASPSPVPPRWQLQLSATQVHLAGFAPVDSIVASPNGDVWLTGGGASRY